MVGIILAIIWFTTIMYLDVQSDYKRISKNTINHTRGAIVRTFCSSFPLLGVYTFHYQIWLYGI